MKTKSQQKTGKIDLFKLHKDEYAAPKKPLFVDTQPTTYLAITGQGAPGGVQFTADIGALYGMAFTLKMTRKFAGLQDYAVCKLEGLWWSDHGPDLSKVPKTEWRWKLLIRTPNFIKQTELDSAVAVLLERGKGPEVKLVQLETLTEGKCVQMLHVGPYEKVCETIDLMKAFAGKQGYILHGFHHEIYLSDPRRVAPAQLKTIIREPTKKVDPTS